MSTNRRGEPSSFPGSSGQSSNNPFRDLEAQSRRPSLGDDEALPVIATPPDNDGNAFMSFPVREPTRHRSMLTRAKTTRRSAKPIKAEAFQTAFENEYNAPEESGAKMPASSSERRPSYASSALLSAHSEFPSYDAVDDVDYSDTARLTGNISQENLRTSRYEPAPIDPAEDEERIQTLQRQLHKRQRLERIATAVRRMSRRVVNLQNRDVMDQRTRVLTPKVSTDNQDIPMTPTPSITSTLSRSSDIPPNIPTVAQMPAVPSPQDRGRIYLAGSSLKMFDPGNPLRRFLARMLMSRWLESIIMLIITLHGIVLIVVGRGTTATPTPPDRWGQSWDQFVLFGIFIFYTLSVVCRIIVFGLIITPPAKITEYGEVIQPPKAFLRHSWNRIDLLSVVAYWVDFILLCTGQEIIGDTQRITVFKMLSALILVRLLNITDGNKVILQSLKKAGPLLVNVAFFILFFFIVFAIAGVQSFKGSFLRRCVWTDPSNSSDVVVTQQYCGGYRVADQEEPLPFLKADGTPGPWSKGFICEQGMVCQETENPHGNTVSFDNIFSSMLIVIITAGSQTWTEPMYDMMDSEYFVAALYFIIIVIIMNYWLINLFVAVINEIFAKVREDSKHSAFATSKKSTVLHEGGEGWSIGENRKRNTVQRATFFAEFMRLSEPIWVLVVIADLVVLGWKNNSMSQEQLDSLARVEIWFSLVFLVEILLRWASQWRDWLGFFDKKKNRADFLIAIATCIIQIPAIRQHSIAYAWLSGFQVLRIYRVMVVIPRLRTLLGRVLGSVEGLINLVFFIILATLLASIMAFQLFEGLMNDSEEEMRFFSIYNSYVAMNQLFSGEDWTAVLYSTMEDGVPTKNTAIHAIFLSLWFLFSNFVLVNLFITVLLENFETAEEEKRQRQIQQYAMKMGHVVDHDPIVSKWNIYRYFRPHPQGLNISGMPANLVLHTQKIAVKDFMADTETPTFEQDKQLIGTPNVKTTAPEGAFERRRRFARAKEFLEGLLTRHNGAASSSATRRSIYFDGSNSIEQLGTFYNNRKHVSGRSLQFLMEFSALRDAQNAASRSTMETMMHDAEERQALRKEFIASHPSYDKSLYLFSSSNPIRRWCQKLVPPSRGERINGTQPSILASWLFFGLIGIAIVTTVVLTIYNSPVYQFEHRDDPNHLLIFTHLDWVFTIIFSIEFIIKVIADGFLMTPNAYLLNGWNILDLFVLTTLYVSNFNSFAGSTGVERAFRAFKALRALRLINLLKPARETFTAILVKGLPHIVDAGLFGVFLIIPFALYGQNLFQGLFYMCNDGDDAIIGKSQCLNEAQLSIQEPLPEDGTIWMPRLWQNPFYYSFDSFFQALLILFEIASGEGWIDVLITSMSITGKDLSPRPDASQGNGIFFMVYNLVGSVLVISLFLGVVLENFSKRNGSAYLTADQRRWLDLKKLLGRMRPAKRPQKIPEHGIRKRCFDLSVEKRGKFYKLMTGVIILNILFLCTESDYDDKVPGLTKSRTYVYIFFITVYWIEIAIKLLGLGWDSFRRNMWNLFDLAAVTGSTVTVVTALAMDDNNQMNVEAQKLFMTAFCFKLVQRSDSLNQLFTTIAASAYQIVNVFAVWFIVITTYAIMFMEIFGLTKYGSQATTEHVNFRTFSNTMINLVRYSTGEAWNYDMHDYAVEFPNCVDADNYLDSDCGSIGWSYFLFLSFNIISMYIFTAIFVAVVADNFSYVYQIAANFSLVNRDEIRKFKRTWAEFDTKRTGFIGGDDLVPFWRRLEGTFETRVYSPEFSYKALTQQCATDKLDSSDPYAVRIDLKALNNRLAQMNVEEVQRRRRDLNTLYWEAALTETPRGVSFNQMLLMLAERKLIVPENALLFEELVANKRKEDAIKTLIDIDRVRGMMETIAIRKEFLQHLNRKRGSKDNMRELPSIRIDDRLSEPRHYPLFPESIPGTPVTPTGFGVDDNASVHSVERLNPSSSHQITLQAPDMFVSNDHDSYSRNDLLASSVESEAWQEMLEKELGKR